MLLQADTYIPRLSGAHKFGLMSECCTNLLCTLAQGSLGQTAQALLFQVQLPWHLPCSAHCVSPMHQTGGSSELCQRERPALHTSTKSGI